MQHDKKFVPPVLARIAELMREREEAQKKARKDRERSNKIQMCVNTALVIMSLVAAIRALSQGKRLLALGNVLSILSNAIIFYHYRKEDPEG